MGAGGGGGKGGQVLEPTTRKNASGILLWSQTIEVSPQKTSFGPDSLRSVAPLIEIQYMYIFKLHPKRVNRQQTLNLFRF